jgi:nucleotide-binding universal stress UspA family protein
MASVATSRQIALKNILYLTDFSQAAEAALPFVKSIAREYGSRVFMLHILLPDPYASMAPECADVVNDGLKQAAQANMERMEARLQGLPHESMIKQAPAVWPTVQEVIQHNHVDLVLLGTHGRGGFRKLLLGSVAEEIIRRSTVPVVTIGPAATNLPPDGKFRCVLFATDLEPASASGIEYAISVAEQSQAQLVLLHVIRQFRKEEVLGQLLQAEAIGRLANLIPEDAALKPPPAFVVEYGDPAQCILDTAAKRGADLIVLGVRTVGHPNITTHLERTIVHAVASCAPCPVLTVRT